MAINDKALALEALIEESLHPLAQLRQFLNSLSPHHYQEVLGERKMHTLGKHVRHIIDHYDALLDKDISSFPDSLNYENRERDVALEQSPPLAVEHLRWIERGLQALKQGSATSHLSLTYPDDLTTLTLDSSLERELAFLTSHTIHHMALIGLLAESLGLRVPETFGVHPSTLRHWQRESLETSARSA